MRIISGYLGGRVLFAPAGNNTRPTSDRVRESLFAILGERVLDAEVLDLFSGSGSLGIEAVSRGAVKSTFVDFDKVAIDTVTRNVKTLGIENYVRIVKSDVFKALSRLSQKEKFDLIFADPPYKAEFYDRILESVTTSDLLKKTGVLVLEYSAHNKPAESKENLRLIRSEKYGETIVGFYMYS